MDCNRNLIIFNRSFTYSLAMALFLAFIHSTAFKLSFAGFMTAAGVDLHTYSESPEGSKFNWGKALARWVGGAITGSGIGNWLA